MRRILLVLAVALLGLPGVARADGDPASDLLAFQTYWLPYAPATPPAAERRLHDATAAAAKAGFPIRVAVISGTYDLGVVPQYDGRPQAYATFLAQELRAAYTGQVLVVMHAGYGLAGARAEAETAAIAGLAKPASGAPGDLTNAGAGVVMALAGAAGKQLGVDVPVQPERAASASGGRPTMVLVLAAGGVVLLGALAALAWRRRRTPGVRGDAPPAC